MATATSTAYSVGSGGTIAGGRYYSLQIDGNYERAAMIPSESYVDGDGDSAIVYLSPSRTESELGGPTVRVWREPSARLRGAFNKRPTIRITHLSDNDQGQWINNYSSHPPMFSEDGGYTWQYFSTFSFSVGNGWIECRHNVPFAADTVFIGRGRQMSVHQAGERLAAFAASYPSIVVPADSAVAFTPTGTLASDYVAQEFIAAEYATQVNDDGATVAKTPFYAAKISDASLPRPGGGAKYKIWVCGGVHAAEDHGDHLMMWFIHHWLGNTTEAIHCRTYFDMIWYPMMNAPGRAGGAVRGAFQDQAGGGDDLNRHFHESPANLQIVDIPRAALATDLGSGVAPKVHLAWHAPFSGSWGIAVDTVPATETFRAGIQTHFGSTVADNDNTPVGSTVYYVNTLGGCDLATHMESGDASNAVTTTLMSNFGLACVKALADQFPS